MSLDFATLISCFHWNLSKWQYLLLHSALILRFHSNTMKLLCSTVTFSLVSEYFKTWIRIPSFQYLPAGLFGPIVLLIRTEKLK